MKGGFCVICTSLLTISVISSCALFILVVSEALQGEGDLAGVDASGLRNVSNKGSISGADEGKKVPGPEGPEPPPDGGVGDDTKKFLQDHEMTFADTLSLNSVTTDGLPDAGQPPILLSLADNAKLDLKPEELLYTNDSEQHNDTKTFTIVEEKEDKPETLVVQAKPMHETRQIEDAFTTTPTPIEEVESQTPEPETETTPEVTPQPTTPQEDIPSFSEWAQKQLAEAEKQDTVLNHSSQTSHSNTNFSSKSTKVRSKNYASPACGAKVIAVNPEAGSASSILSPNRDEYMLNTCNSRIWFVVELCEAIQAQKIELANFELFSSTPKDISVSFSDRYPTREWASVGQFTAADERDVQSFDLYPHMFGKFIKVDISSHHGSEHYCPVSLFKVYGTSEFEVLEKESSQHPSHIEEDEDDDIIDVPDVPVAMLEQKNLFGSARDAVMSIMKKAAQVLAKSEVPKNVSNAQNDTSRDMYKKCCSPSHIIVCDNCSESLYNEVYELISCSSDRLTNLLKQVFLVDTLKCTGVCQPFGLDFKSTKTIEFAEERVAYINALFPQKYLAALCNILAIKEKKVVLNTSFEAELNVTNTTEEANNNTSETSEQNVKTVPARDNTSLDDAKIEPIEPPKIVETQINGELVTEEPKPEKVEDKVEPTPLPEQKTSEPVEPIKPVETEGVQGTQKLDDVPKDSLKIEPKKVEDKPKENGEEMTEQILIESDSYLSDLDQLAADPTPTGAPAQNPIQGQTQQKESVFLRLSNRVKTLERNMSLSGQYLEELSRRYKKQVEEMQKTFEKTVLQMTEERRKSNEREQKYLDQMTTMQQQMGEMAAAMKILMEERDSWFGNITFFKFLILQSIIAIGIIYYVTKRRRVAPIVLPITKKVKKKEKLRRKSVEGVSGHETPSIKKRRPSEEALNIARQSTDEMSREDDDGEWQVARKNRRRKTSIIHRNMENRMWGRQDSIGALQENPIPLDDAEFLAPVSEPTEFNEENIVQKELPKTNGSLFNNIKNKTMKTRRLSSPAFLRTFSRQSSRSTPSPVVRNLEPIYNGVKAQSESPTGSLWSESTEISQVNGFDDKRKKRKGLKNIFRKVF